MKKKKTSSVYKIIRWIVKVFYPKISSSGFDRLPPEPMIFVGNHSQMNGPICCELYFPAIQYTWCAGEMMEAKQVPGYAFRDFWSHKPAWCRWFYKLLSYLIVPLSVCVFNNANTIGVYRDARILSTFKKTVQALQEGANVVIFPEHDVPHNHILCDFQDKFIDVAKLYYKRTGKAVRFVPMYIAPKLKTMYFGEPIAYCPELPMEQQRQQIKKHLMDSVTELACSLPEHTVIPYRNIGKKHYLSNKP